MRLFNVLAYQGTFTMAEEVFSLPTLEPLFGRAEKLVLQILCARCDGAAPTLTVTEQTSEDGVYWWDRDTLLGGGALSSDEVTQFYCYDPGTSAHGGRVRLRFQLGGSGTVVNMLVYVCGRAR